MKQTIRNINSEEQWVTGPIQYKKLNHLGQDDVTLAMPGTHWSFRCLFLVKVTLQPARQKRRNVCESVKMSHKGLQSTWLLFRDGLPQYRFPFKSWQTFQFQWRWPCHFGCSWWGKRLAREAKAPELSQIQVDHDIPDYLVSSEVRCWDTSALLFQFRITSYGWPFVFLCESLNCFFF